MADMFVLAHLGLSVPIQQPLLLTHAQLPLSRCYFDEPAIAPRTEREHPPHHFIFTTHDHSFLKGEEPLCKWMVNIDVQGLIPILRVFFVSQQPLLILFLNFDELPNIVLGDVVRSIGAARYFIEYFALWMFYFMSVEVILGLQIAKNHRLTQQVRFTIAIYFMQRFVQNLQILFLHLDQRTNHHLTALVGQ